MCHACFSCWECSVPVDLIIRLVIDCVKRFITWGHFLQQIISNWVPCWNPWIIFWLFGICILYYTFFARCIIAYYCWTGVRIKYHLHCLRRSCCLFLVTGIKFLNSNTLYIRWIRQDNKINFIMKFFRIPQFDFKTSWCYFILRFFPGIFQLFF